MTTTIVQGIERTTEGIKYTVRVGETVIWSRFVGWGSGKRKVRERVAAAQEQQRIAAEYYSSLKAPT